jgi:starch synthase
MLKNRNIKIPTLLTIHNAEYQGQFTLNEAQLLCHIDFENRDKRRKSFNSLALGIEFCTVLNTVSPNYAKELLQKTNRSFGLNKLLVKHKGKFSGIINGADYELWNPQTDSYLIDHFSAENLAGKNKNKRRLLKKCNWNYSTQPVIGMVSRLVTTKGFTLLLKAIDGILSTNVRLVILGTGNAKIVRALKRAEIKYPNQISFHNYFDEKMAHLIEAGADMFLMPSRYEPCGLNQLYSLRYGTIPIIFNTGGLADTITNWNESDGDGFVFYRFTTKELINVIHIAVKSYQDNKLWKRLIKNAMNVNYSWSNSAKKYLNLYLTILEKNCDE